MLLSEVKESFLHLFFPHICAGCGNDILNKETSLCGQCINSLPETHFELHPGNPVEKRFWGRLPVQNATAQYYFTGESLIQRLVHQFKYRANKELGKQLGHLMGNSLKRSGRFDIDALIPLPLFPVKERKRGFNQSYILCQGIAEYFHIPIFDNIIKRPQHTETQTHKGRIERWKNMEGKFELVDAAAVENKHVLLVDDVITTGSTLESCGSEILKAGNVRLSIACLCDATS